jgi:hypothetical protein
MNFEAFTKWFATSPVASFLRVALALFLSQAMADFVKVGSFDFSNINTWIITALAAAVPGLLRWINPSDPAFGSSKAG